MKQITAEQIAALLDAKIEGNPQALVHGFGKIEEARAGQLTFLANPKYEDHLYNTQATIAIINENLQLKATVKPTLLRVPNAYTAFASLLDQYQQLMQAQLSGIDEQTFIHTTVKYGNNIYIGAFTYVGENVKMGHNVKIYPGCYIGDDVIIGDNVMLDAGVKIYRQCRLGNNITIHAGTVIGGDGFGFAPQADGTYKKVPQIGNVVIEDDVEIGCNTTIDRATIGSTVIRKGVKIDNLVQLAHNVEIGENTVLAAQVGISGSTKIGKNVVAGGQVGIVGHLNIADGVKMNGQAGLTKSIKQKNVAVTGSPAGEYNITLRSQVVAKHLPEIEKKIQWLERQVANLMSEKANASAQ